MSLSQGDVVLITFPFADLTSAKVRPALVLSNNTYNVGGEDVIVCLITSNMSRKGLYLTRIDTSDPDYRKGGFKAPCAIITDKIHALHRSLIKRKLGSVGDKTITEVRDNLKEIVLN